MNLTIKEKMYLLTVVVCLVTISIVVLSLYSIQSLHKISYAQDLSRQAHIEMLMLRRYEKDFITRKELKYEDKFKTNMSNLIAETTELSAQREALGMSTEAMKELVGAFNEYNKQFDLLVKIETKIGFDHQSGLHGELRTAVKNVESQLANNHSDELLVNALLLRKNEKDFIQRRDFDYVMKFEKNFARFSNTLSLSNLSASNKTSIAELMDQYKAAFVNMSEAYQQRGLTSKLGIMGSMRDAVHQSESLLKAVLDDTLVLAAEKKQQVEVVIFCVAFILAAFLVIALLLLVRNIVGSLERLITEMDSIAKGKGDLRVRLPAEGRGEMARLSGAFNCFVARIQLLVKDVSIASSSLASAAEQSALSVDHTADMLNKQEHETNLIATAIQQMSATVAEVARNAATASDATQAANLDSLRGKNVVDESNAAIKLLASEVQRASDVIVKLAERSLSIGHILEVIQGVAEKTNLLALNAAIEAARAGEQGRGFAVVADEVRELAQRTQQATNEIALMVEGIKEGVDNATQVMGTSRESANQVVHQTIQAGEALDSIASGVDTISDLNAQIASASEQQAMVSGELSENVNNINNCAVETSASADQIRSSSTELALLSKQLFGLTSQFKV